MVSSCSYSFKFHDVEKADLVPWQESKSGCCALPETKVFGQLTHHIYTIWGEVLQAQAHLADVQWASTIPVFCIFGQQEGEG
jgi:hypothetical protein